MTLRSILPAGVAERPKDRGRLFVSVNLPFGMPLDAEREWINDRTTKIQVT
jgi:hypothetical protein